MKASPPPILAFDRVGAEWMENDQGSVSITWFAPLQFEFQCKFPSLHRLEVFLEPISLTTDTEVWLRIDYVSQGHTRPLRISGPLRVGLCLSGGWFAFEFAPILNSADAWFRATLISPDATPVNAPRFRATGSVPHQTLFRATCIQSQRQWNNFTRYRQSESRHNTRVAHLPIMVRLETSRPCDLTCVMCLRGLNPYNAKKEGTGFLRLETLHALEPLIPTLLWVNAFGLGEPLLNRDFVELLRYIRQRNPFVHIFASTNATRLTPDLIEVVVEENLLDSIQVSIDGVDAPTYLAIRGKPLYDRVVSHLIALIQKRNNTKLSKLVVKVEMLVMKPTYQQIFDYVAKMAGIGVDRIVLDTPKGREFSELQCDSAEEWDVIANQVSLAQNFLLGSSTVMDGPLRHEIEARQLRNGKATTSLTAVWDSAAVLKPDEVTDRFTTRCRLPWESFKLSAEGIVRPCCNSDRNMSDASAKNIPQVWTQGSDYQNLRNELRQNRLGKECEICLANNVVPPDLVTPSTYDRARVGDVTEQVTALWGPTESSLRLVQRDGTWIVAVSSLCAVPLSPEQTGGFRVRMLGWVETRETLSSDTFLYIVHAGSFVAFAKLGSTQDLRHHWAATWDSKSMDLNDDSISFLVDSTGTSPMSPFRQPAETIWYRNETTDTPFISRPQPWLKGCVDEIVVTTQGVSIRGWTLDLRDEHSSPNVVVSTLHGHFTSEMRQRFIRPDIQQTYAIKDLRTRHGFVIDWVRQGWEVDDILQINVYAEIDQETWQPLPWITSALEARYRLLQSTDELIACTGLG